MIAAMPRKASSGKSRADPEPSKRARGFWETIREGEAIKAEI
jgi:hypothetical protein